jgi:hypothetical protein
MEKAAADFRISEQDISDALAVATRLDSDLQLTNEIATELRYYEGPIVEGRFYSPPPGEGTSEGIECNVGVPDGSCGADDLSPWPSTTHVEPDSALKSSVLRFDDSTASGQMSRGVSPTSWTPLSPMHAGVANRDASFREDTSRRGSPVLQAVASRSPERYGANRATIEQQTLECSKIMEKYGVKSPKI